jgi:hypothetical protein
MSVDFGPGEFLVGLLVQPNRRFREPANYALYRTGHDKVAGPWPVCPVDKRER